MKKAEFIDALEAASGQSKTAVKAILDALPSPKQSIYNFANTLSRLTAVRSVDLAYQNSIEGPLQNGVMLMSVPSLSKHLITLLPSSFNRISRRWYPKLESTGSPFKPK